MNIWYGSRHFKSLETLLRGRVKCPETLFGSPLFQTSGRWLSQLYLLAELEWDTILQTHDTWTEANFFSLARAAPKRQVKPKASRKTNKSKVIKKRAPKSAAPAASSAVAAPGKVAHKGKRLTKKSANKKRAPKKAGSKRAQKKWKPMLLGARPEWFYIWLYDYSLKISL